MYLEGCIVDCGAVLGEGPVWVAREQAIYWVDVKGPRIFRRCDNGAVTSWEPPFRIGSLAPRAAGGFVAGSERGFALIDPAAGRYEVIGECEPDRPNNRFNDGKLDRSRRFWAGTMDDREVDASGALYRLEPTLEWTRVDDGYKVTNGPAFSPDGRTMYHNDSALQLIYAFDLDDVGKASNKRVFADASVGDGYPDGMAVDAEGCLWVAYWDGWCLRRFSPAGACVATLNLPVQRPTSCTFGGPDLDQLFITSARIGLSDAALAAQPHAGGLFAARSDICGVADTPFAG